jgi:hypothetical protein
MFMHQTVLSIIIFQVTEDEDGKCCLEIKDAVTTDTGSISCRAVNCFSETSVTADLWVLPSVDEPLDLTRRGSIVPPSALTQLSVEEQYEESLVPLPVVNAVAVDEDDSSSGRSFVYDDEGEEPHFAAVEEKVTPPLIISGPRSVTVMKGESTLLRANFVGNPTPVIKWYRGVSNIYMYNLNIKKII